MERLIAELAKLVSNELAGSKVEDLDERVGRLIAIAYATTSSINDRLNRLEYDMREVLCRTGRVG